jgi:mono/diheme cytochrome c family protein
MKRSRGLRRKAVAIGVGAAVALAACRSGEKKRFVIAESKSYAASIFRQNCAICHGAEAEGRTLADGTRVPSLRDGEFKFRSEAEVYRQIAEGGHGMLPFRGQLSDRELKMLVQFVRRDLRGER